MKATAKISIQPDCGNSPRKGFLKNLHTYMATGDLDALTEIIPEEISWDIVSQKHNKGKLNVVNALQKSPLWKVKSLSVDTMITHGSEASVSGVVIPAKGKEMAFCNIYKFSGAGGFRLVSITSFFIDK